MSLMVYPASLSIPSWRTRTVRSKREPANLRPLICPGSRDLLSGCSGLARRLKADGTINPRHRHAAERIAGAAIELHVWVLLPGSLGRDQHLLCTPGDIPHPASSPNDRILAVASLMAYLPFPGFTQGSDNADERFPHPILNRINQDSCHRRHSINYLIHNRF
jgi:hypothetical protein